MVTGNEFVANLDLAHSRVRPLSSHSKMKMRTRCKPKTSSKLTSTVLVIHTDHHFQLQIVDCDWGIQSHDKSHVTSQNWFLQHLLHTLSIYSRSMIIVSQKRTLLLVSVNSSCISTLPCSSWARNFCLQK